MKQYLLPLLLSSLIFTACQQQELEPILPSGLQELHFRTYLEEGGEIRSVTRSVVGDQLSAGYYLNGLLSTSDYPASVTYDRLMWNVAMNADGTYKFSSEKKYFWAEGNAALRHTFVAYSANPTGSSGGSTSSSLTGATSGQPLLSLDYTNADDPARQIDFLYADNASNLQLSKYTPVVNLIFKHRLARVMVKLIGLGGVTLTECQATIKYNANAVKNTGKVYLSDNGTITLGGTYHASTTTYKLGASFTLSGSAISEATAAEMGDLILLPKQLLAGGWATLTLSYKPDGAVSAQSITMDMPVVDLTAAAGQQYNILVNVNVESQNLSVAGVTLSNWTAKSTTIDKL